MRIYNLISEKQGHLCHSERQRRILQKILHFIQDDNQVRDNVFDTARERGFTTLSSQLKGTGGYPLSYGALNQDPCVILNAVKNDNLVQDACLFYGIKGL